MSEMRRVCCDCCLEHHAARSLSRDGWGQFLLELMCAGAVGLFLILCLVALAFAVTS